MTTIIFDTAEGAYDNWPKGTIPRLDDSFQLIDILQLVSHCGRKLALVHIAEGFAWFSLDAIIAAAPIIFNEYVAWYIDRFEINPLDELSDGDPSPPRPIPPPPIQEFDSSAADSEQLLPASPYGSADIVLVYSAAILSGRLDILRHDWLAFLDDEKHEELQEQLETKVRLMLFWKRFKACSSFWKSKKLAILRRQRAVARSWYTWRNQAEKSASIHSVLTVFRFSLVQTAFSTIRDSAQLTRHISFMYFSIQQIYSIRAFSKWRSQFAEVVAFRKASNYRRVLILKEALELLREYSAGAAAHTHAVCIQLQLRAFVSWRKYAHQLWTLSDVAAARNLTLLDFSFQALRRFSVDRHRLHRSVGHAEVFQLFGAFTAWRRVQKEDIQAVPLINYRTINLISSFRSWRQSAAEIAEVDRILSVATGHFLSRPLGPEWPSIPAHLSCFGWQRSLSVARIQGDFWEDRRLCFLPFIKWLSITRSSALPEGASAGVLALLAGAFSTPAESFLLRSNPPEESCSLISDRLVPRVLKTVNNGVCADLPLVPPEVEISAGASEKLSLTATIPPLHCNSSIAVRSLLPSWKLWRSALSDGLTAKEKLESVSNRMIRNHFKTWRGSLLPSKSPSLYHHPFRLSRLRRLFLRWRKQFMLTLSCCPQWLITAHTERCQFSNMKLSFESWVTFRDSKMVVAVDLTSAVAAYRITSCRSALQNFRDQSFYSSDAGSAMQCSLTSLLSKAFRAFSLQCTDLADSAYSRNSAVTVRNDYLLKLGWTRMVISLATARTSAAAVTSYKSSSCRRCLVSLRARTRTLWMESAAFKRGTLVLLSKYFCRMSSVCETLSVSSSSSLTACLFLRRSSLQLGWNSVTSAAAVSKLMQEIDKKVPPTFGSNWTLAEALRLLGANARWFSFAVHRHTGKCWDRWREVADSEMDALKPVRRASPASALEWVMLIRDTKVASAYSRLSKFWTRLDRNRYLGMKHRHMIFLCKTRARVNVLWSAFAKWQVYSEVVAPDLHPSDTVIDRFAKHRPSRSAALLRMTNEAFLQAVPGSAVIPLPHLLLPVSCWPLELRSKVDLVRAFSKLSNPIDLPTEDFHLPLLDLLAPIPADLTYVLETPARLWSCSFSGEEFDLADNFEKQQHYTFVWLIPLWLSHNSDSRQAFMFWNCHSASQVELEFNSYLASGRQIAENELIEVVLAFGGASFVEPVFALPENFNVFDCRTINGATTEAATSVGAAAGCTSPSPVSEDLTDLGALARAEAAANIRSPFLEKDVAKPSDPVPQHVGSPVSALNHSKFHPGVLVHLSADVTVKGAVVVVVPPLSVTVIWFHSGAQQTIRMHNLSVSADISTSHGASPVAAPRPSQGPLAIAREACKAWQTAALVEETLIILQPLVNRSSYCRHLCSIGKQTLTALLLEHLCSWSSKVPDTTPFGCVSGTVSQWAVEMESKPSFDFWLQKKVNQLQVTPTPDSSLVGIPASPSSAASDASPVNPDPSVCYNPVCSEPVDPTAETCRACNFPSATIDFYCFCNRRCNPMKRYCFCRLPLLHHLKEDAQLALIQSQHNRSSSQVSACFVGRSKTFQAKIIYTSEELRLFSNMRHGQDPSRLYGSVEMSPQEMFLKLLDTPLGSTMRKAGGVINKFRIAFTHRLYYLTTNTAVGGDVSWGLQGWMFARVFTGVMECPKFDAVLDFKLPVKPLFPNGSSYLDIDTWIAQNSCMAAWYADLMQSAYAQEIKALIEHLSSIYSLSLIEETEVTLLEIDNVFCAILSDFRSEHLLFISSPVRHLERFPDSVILQLGRVRRPKMWIVDDVGEERASFKMSFRELRRLAGIQKLDLLAKQVKQLSNRAGGTKANKHGGGSSPRAAFLKAWKKLDGKPVSVDDALISLDDWRIAKEHYAILCAKMDNGEFKDCKNLCWKFSSPVGCPKKGAKCQMSHEKHVPEELAREFLTGQLVMSVFGGFTNMPLEYDPQQVTATIRSLKTKIAASMSPAKKFGGIAAVTNSDSMSPDVHPSVASLLLVRPIFTLGNWNHSVPSIDVGGETIPILASRLWQCQFPGPMTSSGLYFKGLELNGGEHLAGESMKCFMIAQGAAHGVSPSVLLQGYRADAVSCQAKLPPGTCSLVKMHLDFFQMSYFESLPPNIEICDDLLQLDQPLSHHCMQILEQADLAGKVTIIIEVGRTTESDKLLRASVRFIVLVSKTAPVDAPVAVLKAEKLHCTWIKDFQYSFDGSSWINVDVFQRFLDIRDILETTTQVAFKLCCNIQDTLSQFDGIAWPEYLPPAAIPVGELPDWHSLGVSSNVDYELLLIPFQCAAALHNPTRRPLVELRFAIRDNLLTLTALAESESWNKFDLTNCNCSSFPIDNSVKPDYNVWLQDSVDLKADSAWFSAYLQSFELILLSWGFHADGSVFNPAGSAGTWNGNVARLYHMARSAWLFGCAEQLLALQLVAKLVSATACHSSSGFDHSVLLRFVIPVAVKNGGVTSCNLPSVDIKLLSASKELHALTKAGIANPAKYTSCLLWFGAYVTQTIALTEAVDEKFTEDYLTMFVRFSRMFHPGSANNFADPVRVAEKLIFSDVNLENYLGKRLVRIHRTGIPVELLGRRSFTEKATNLPEAELHNDLTLKACRKLTVSGMMILWPEAVLHIVKKWEILISPMGIVFTEKKPISSGGRIIQACSANKRGDALNWLTTGEHDWLPCVYDGSTAAAKAYFAADDQLKACIESVKDGEDPLVLASLQNFVGLSYVDDNHGIGHNGTSVCGTGSDGCHAFSTNSQDEASVGSISVHLKVEEKWQKIFGTAVIGGYTADNFGWCGSPAQYQPIALSIKAGVQGSNPASVAALLPGYVYKVEDRPTLMLCSLITHMRYVIGYEGKIDFSKTQEVTSNLERLGSVLHLAEGEISVSVPHLDKAISVLSEVFVFKSENLAGIPLRWLQRCTSHIRFASCYPKSWMTGFLAMFVRCVSGIHSDALPDHLCSPAMPHQTLEEGLDSFYRCCTTLLMLLVSIHKKPALGRVPLFMLLPPQEALFRADWSALGFSGEDACDDGFSTMLFEPNERKKIEVLLMTWPPEVLELLQKMRHQELRTHSRDFITMGNLEHFAILANNLQWASTRYFRRMIYHITDSVNAKGCVNRSFSPNFIDQEMRRLASWFKVLYSWSETATWVNTWMNLFNDLLSRLFHHGCLQGKVLEQIHEFAHTRGFEIEFVKPAENVCIAMRWLANPDKCNLSLVKMFEHLYADSVDSDASSSLVQDVADRVAAATAPKLGAEPKQPLISLSVPLSLDTAGCCSTSIIDLRSLALSLISNFESKPVMTSTNFACGMGGFTIGGMLAGFLPIQNKDIAASAAKFHEYLTGGFGARGDLRTLKAARLLVTHLLTIGFPCQSYSVMGNELYDDGEQCLVKVGVNLILSSGAVMVLAECVPALRTAKGGAVWSFIVKTLSPQYYFADATLVLKYFDHSTNRQRFFFVCANKDYFDSNPFGPLPTGHLCSDADIPPMSRALQDPDSVPVRFHRYTDVEVLAPSITPVRGFLTRVSKISASKFKGSPLFPNHENNPDGLSSTLLSTPYLSRSDRLYAANPPASLPADYKKALLNDLARGSFGVNTGLYSRTLASGKRILTSLMPVEQCSLGNFSADTYAVATQLGLSEDEISCGVNGAVPPTASFTLSSWLMSIIQLHEVPVVLVQKSSRPYHCGVSSVQELLTSDGFSKKWGGCGELCEDSELANCDVTEKFYQLLIFNQTWSLMAEFQPDGSHTVPLISKLNWQITAADFATSLGLRCIDIVQLSPSESSSSSQEAPVIILVVESRQLRQCCWSWLPIETASVRLQTSQSCKCWIESLKKSAESAACDASPLLVCSKRFAQTWSLLTEIRHLHAACLVHRVTACFWRWQGQANVFHRLLENKGILVWDSDHEDYDDDAKALALFGTDQYVTSKTSASMVGRVVPVAAVCAAVPQTVCKLQSQKLPATAPVAIPRQKVTAPTMSEICGWTPQKPRMQLGFLPTGFVNKFESSVDDEKEQYRLDSDMRTFGCTTVKWSKDRINLFQDMTSSALLQLWLLKVNWKKWRTVYSVELLDSSSEFGQKMGGSGASLASSNVQRPQLIKLKNLVALTMQHCLLQQCLVEWNIAVAVVKVASALHGVSVASNTLMEPPACMHPDLICPGGWLQNGVDYVENMFCSHCDAKVDADLDSCWEACDVCEKISSEASSSNSSGCETSSIDLMLYKVLQVVGTLPLSDRLQLALSTWLDRVMLQCNYALFIESPPQADHFQWQARVDRHCELMSANVYAELCHLDAQPVVLPAVRSSRAHQPAYIESSMSGSAVQSSSSTSSDISGCESRKDWCWWATALSVKVYIMLFKAACRAVRSLRRSNCQSMMLSHGAVGDSASPLLQLISLDPLDQLICDEVGWVPTQDLTEGLLASMSPVELLEASIGDNHWTCNALRSYHSSAGAEPWDDHSQRCLINHLRMDSLDHQAVCASLLLDALQLVCRRLRILVTARVDGQARSLRTRMCLGTNVLLPLLDTYQVPSEAFVKAALSNWRSHISGQLVECLLRSRMRTSLNVILGIPLTDQLFLCYGARIHQFDSGAADPCVTRAPNFATHLPIRNHHPLDCKVTAVSKLVDESVSDSCLDLSRLYLVSRSPVVAALVKSKLLPLLFHDAPVVKLGADQQPVYGFSNPRHPTLGSKRKLLECVPDADEIADENDFQAAAFASSLAPSSSKKYTGAMRDFMQYLDRNSIMIDFDLQKEELIAFLRKWIRRFLLSEGGVRGLSFSAINGKSYGIRWHFLISHEIDVLEGWIQHKVFMRGVKRLRHHPARKIPVSWSLLLLIINSLDLSSYRHLVIAAGLILGWYFGTRISELINFRLCSIVLYDAHGTVLSLMNPNLVELAVEVDLKFGVAKNDQHGEGAIRSHHCTRQVLCCVRALAAMLVARVTAGAVMNPDAPLFLFFDGSDCSVTDDRLDRAIVARTLKAGAAAAGIPAARVSCHSLRSGGATAMLRAGKSYEDVRCFYRWRSDVARIYLRSVRGAMHDVSALMASGAGMATVMLAGN